MEKKKLERLDAKTFRSLNPGEVRQVHGSRTFRTLTFCSFYDGKLDGDTFEC